MMFPEKMYEHIARETNRYADEVIEGRVLGPKSRLRDWTKTNPGEIKSFIGLRIAMGLCEKPTLDDYWSEWWVTQTPAFSKVMLRNRFKLLCSFIHFVDNATRLDKDDENYDPLFKIQPILSSVTKSWQESITLGKNLSIDESMIGFRGRIFFRQYIKSKHHRFGIKGFVLCCGKTSYTYHIDIYAGSLYEYDRQVGQGHSVVRKLCEGLQPGHTLYLDSFYTAPALCKEMFNKGIGICGTVTQGRKGMPEGLRDRSVTLKEGDKPLFLYKSPVLADCLWTARM